MKLFFKTLIVFAVIAIVVCLNIYLYLDSRYRRLFDWEIESFTAKAHNNDADAIMRLDFYYTNYLNEIDINQAIDFYRIINDRTKLSDLLLLRGSSSDISEAMIILKELVDQNNTIAMRDLKNMYMRGNYVDRNLTKALYWATRHDCQASSYEYENITKLLFSDNFLYDKHNMLLAYAIVVKNLTADNRHYGAAQYDISRHSYAKLIERYNQLKAVVIPKLSQDEIRYIDTHYDEIIEQNCQQIEQGPDYE